MTTQTTCKPTRRNKSRWGAKFKFYPDDIQKLCALWHQTPQLSLTQIGDIFGVNKNVINGKVQRLIQTGVLPPRGSPLGQKLVVTMLTPPERVVPTAEESQAYLAKLARLGWPSSKDQVALNCKQ